MVHHKTLVTGRHGNAQTPLDMNHAADVFFAPISFKLTESTGKYTENVSQPQVTCMPLRSGHACAARFCRAALRRSCVPVIPNGFKASATNHK